MKKKDNNLRRKKSKKRVRGAPAFFQPETSNLLHKEMVMAPESSTDVARLVKDEIKKRWPDATGLPETISGKHIKLIKNILEEFPNESVKEMVRILVWDFDEIKKNKGFFPTSNHLNWPWIDQLYNYRHALAGAIGKGITDSTSRVSAYAQRYHSDTSPTDKPVSTEGESMRDIAKRVLGH